MDSHFLGAQPDTHMSIYALVDGIIIMIFNACSQYHCMLSPWYVYYCPLLCSRSPLCTVLQEEIKEFEFKFLI